MSSADSTKGIPVESPDRERAAVDATTGGTWSFGTRERIFALPAGRVSRPGRSRSTVFDELVEPTLPRLVDPGSFKPVRPPQQTFGKRGFVALYQWQGVVEEIIGSGFRVRLFPYERGQADRSRVEYTEFDFDDLADESDIELLTEGAVLYWTVGKSRNAAGTHTNTSLVRLRRLPPTSQRQMESARGEAEALLDDLRTE
jgi:hypothetical protein